MLLKPNKTVLVRFTTCVNSEYTVDFRQHPRFTCGCKESNAETHQVHFTEYKSMLRFDGQILHKKGCMSLHCAGHDALILTQQQANLRQNSSLENLSQQLHGMFSNLASLHTFILAYFNYSPTNSMERGSAAERSS